MEASILVSSARSLATPIPVPYQRFKPSSLHADFCQTIPPLPWTIQPASHIFPPHLPILLIDDSSLESCLELDTVLARASFTKPSASQLVDRPVSSLHDSWSLSVHLRLLLHWHFHSRALPCSGSWPSLASVVAILLFTYQPFFHTNMSSQSQNRTSWPYKELTGTSVNDEKKQPDVSIRRTSTSSSDQSLKVPRTPRFAEATTVYSPIEAGESGRSPFADPPKKSFRVSQSFMAEAQPSDIGFGYINDPSRQHVEVPLTPASPLKSAMKVPGTPGRKIDNPLSPTFREEQILEKHEEMTEKEQAKDLVCYKTLLLIAQQN